MYFQSTKQLLYWKWKQVRIASIIWILSLVAITLLTVIAFDGLYQSQQERNVMAETMKNPAMVAMVGPIFSVEDYHTGAMLAHQMLVFTMVVIGVMNCLLMSTLTRKEEEDGRVEFVRALPVGRLASISASVIYLVVVNLLIGFFITVGLIVLNESSVTIIGSIVYGLTIATAGIFFAMLTAFLAQLQETSKGTTGIAIASLFVFYFIRAIGDVTAEQVSFLSPLGLLVRTKSFVENTLWPIPVVLGFSVVFLLLTFFVQTRRDIGSGLIPSRKGKRDAGHLLASPLGLIIRIQFKSMLAWFFALWIVGVSYGSVFGDIEVFIADNEMFQQLIGNNSDYSVTEQFTTLLMRVLAIFATIPGILFFMRIRGEEKKGRVEHLLVRSVARIRVVCIYWMIGWFSAALSLFLGIFGLWLVSKEVMTNPIPFENMFVSSFSYLPAMFFVISLAVWLFGLVPKYTSLIWGYLVFCFIHIYLGGLLEMPEWVTMLSSFAHIPELPMDTFTWKPLISISALAIVVSIIGIIGYKRRDALG